MTEVHCIRCGKSLGHLHNVMGAPSDMNWIKGAAHHYYTEHPDIGVEQGAAESACAVVASVRPELTQRVWDHCRSTSASRGSWKPLPATPMSPQSKPSEPSLYNAIEAAKTKEPEYVDIDLTKI